MNQDDLIHDDRGAQQPDPGHSDDWISSEPPVDDFSDHTHEGEGATISEDHESAEHETQSESDGAGVIAEKKKMPLLLIAGVVGGLALIGGGGYWYMSNGHQDQSTLIDQMAQNTPSSSPLSYANKPADPTPTTAAPIVDTAPTTSYGAPSPQPSGGALLQQAAQAQTGSATPAMATPSVSPSAAVVAAKAMADAAPTTTVSPQAIQPQTSPANNTVEDSRVTALATRLDDVQKMLAQTTQQLGQISDKLSAGQGGGVTAAADPQTTDRLTKLEQKLMQFEQRQAPEPAHTSVVTASNNDDGLTSSHVFPRKPTRARHVIQHKASHASRHHAKAPAATSERHFLDQSAGWVLRAATPDEAWIAKNNDTRELHPVHIGDNLAGIGKVTAIEQSGDGWVLQGTTGNIR